MKVRMYNVGFGDCFCLRDRKKSLLVDFGTNNSRIEGRPRREIFDVIISDLSTIKSKNLLLTHFHMDHLSGLLYMMKKKDISVDFGKIYLPDVFSKKEMSRTLVLLLLADLLKESGLPSRQVSLFALVDALLENKQNVELLSRGKLFENKYQALWPDTDVIRKETDEVYNRICEDGKFKEVMDIQAISTDELIEAFEFKNGTTIQPNTYAPWGESYKDEIMVPIENSQGVDSLTYRGKDLIKDASGNPLKVGSSMEVTTE